MTTEPFTSPQRQSSIGIVLIFLRTVYKFLKGFWAVLLYFIVGDPSDKVFMYGGMGLGVLSILGIIYSYQYYRRFLFYIDEQQSEFVLQKGVFSIDTISIPFDKIQQVDLKRSILQRIIGIYSLVIDTAGSKGDEIEIKAITEKKARALADRLTLYKTQKAEQTTPNNSINDTVTKAGQHGSPTIWQHGLSIWDLIKIGLTRSYLRGFLITLAFVFSTYSKFQNYLSDYLESAETYSKSVINSTALLPLIVVALILIIFILSILVTVGEVVIKHFNLKIKQTRHRLEVEMGLKTNIKVSFQPRRLQRLQIETNPIQKRFALYEAKFSLAGSQDDFKKGRITVPGLSPDIIDKIKSFLYTDRPSTMIRAFNPHRAWLNRRVYLIIVCLSIVWLIDMLLFNQHYFTVVLGFSIFCLGIFLPYQWFLYKTIHLQITEGFLIIKRGLWTQKHIVVELYKLEGLSIKQPFWYRHRQIYNLTFHTAGGDIRMRALPKRFLLTINYMLYKIESAQQAWM